MSEPHFPSSNSETEESDRDLINQLIGRIQMAGAIGQFSLTVGTLELRRIKENKLYTALRGQKGLDKNGNEITDVGTWAGFCKYIHSSQQKVDEDLTNLDAFGQEALDKMRTAGIGYREMRSLRKLPAEETAKIGDRVINTSDKDEVLEIIEDLISAKQEQERIASDLRAAAQQAESAREAAELENDQLKEKLRDKEIHTWPEYTREIRMESSALGDKALLCIDDLERLLPRLTDPELDRNHPERTAHYGAAITAYWTNLRALQARIDRLVGLADKALYDIDDSIEGVASAVMSEDEVQTLVSRRDMLVREHQAETLSRENTRYQQQPRKRGRPRKIAD